MAPLSLRRFLDAFADAVAWWDFALALRLCDERLASAATCPRAVALRGAVEEILAAERAVVAVAQESVAADIEPEAELASPPPSSLVRAARGPAASLRALEAMYEVLREDDVLSTLGEQAVGMFFDIGQIAPEGATRERLLHMAETLLRRLAAVRRQDVIGEGLEFGSDEWRQHFFEMVGLVWWQAELQADIDKAFEDYVQNEWIRVGGSMEILTGWTLRKLQDASLEGLFDALIRTMELERMMVCNVLPGSGPFSLDYGIQSVFEEIRRRPLVEPPLYGFMDHFYLITHVVFVLNSYNGCLPNTYDLCPWAYDFLGRCLDFILRDASLARHSGIDATVGARGGERATMSGAAKALLAVASYREEAVDIVAEALDCLEGLDDRPASDPQMRQRLAAAAAWLLDRQDTETGLFRSPGAPGKPEDPYDLLHPSWTAAAALQADRRSSGNVRCEAWAAHARSAAIDARLAEPPPLRDATALVPGGPLDRAAGNRRLRVLQACLKVQ